MADKTTQIGKVSIVPKGTHDPTKSYIRLDLVENSKDAYISIKDVPAGTPLSNTEYWQKLVSGGNLNYFGNAITGTSREPATYETGISNALVGDMYYYNGTNTSDIGNVYECVTPGNDQVATWKFITNLRGGAEITGITKVDEISPETGTTGVKIYAVSYNSQSTVAGDSVTETMRMNAIGNIHGIHNPAYNESTGAAESIPNGYLLTWDNTNSKWIALEPPESVPSSGEEGQVLAKSSDEDYDMEWKNVHEIPAGGTTRQALLKTDNDDYIVDWQTIHEVPAGGSTNHVLAKATGNNYELKWRSINEVPLNGSAGQYLQRTLSGYSWVTIQRITDQEIDLIINS